MTEALIKTGIDVPQNVLKIVCMIIVTILPVSYTHLLAVLAAVVLVIAAVIFSMAVTGVSAIAGGIVLTGFGLSLIHI